MSWNTYLESIADDKSLLQDEEFKKCPYPLQAIILTSDRINEKLKNKKKALLDPQVTSDGYEFYRMILQSGFDHILTTNYTYELEAASLGEEKISKYRIKNMQVRTQEKAEMRYMLHTYYQVNYGGKENRIWHIHGEHRKPQSIVLGHYYYGNLLYMIKDEISKIDNNRWGKNQHIQRGASWLDAFLFGNIYCLGFGFGVSEFDLWWLLNRKAREKGNVGKFYFYEPQATKYDPKYTLFKSLKNCYGERLVEMIDFNYAIEGGNSYPAFYHNALMDIQKKIM